MRKFEPVMRQQINTFLQLLASPELHEIPINMTVLVKRLTFDIVGLLAFGNNLKTQTDPAYRSLIDAQTAGNHRSNIFLQYPFLYKTKIFSLLELFASDQVLAYYNAIEKMIALRVAEPKHARHDLYSLIVDEMNPDGEYLKNSEIWAEAAFFLPAGADTISGLICASLFYLSRNPDCYAKLASDIRSCFDSGHDVQIGHKLSGCKYLRATLDETLRMSPPAAGTLWREISPEDENKNTPVVIDRHVINLGVQVGVNTYSIHHNEKYFPDSFAFKPERWLDVKLSAGDRRIMQKALIPFSIGARGCAGKAMAYAQCSLVTATLLWYFDFDVASGDTGKLGGGNLGLGDGRSTENEYQLYDVASATHDGPMLVFRQRTEVSGDGIKDRQ
jgi:cytochrome P450